MPIAGGLRYERFRPISVDLVRVGETVMLQAIRASSMRDWLSVSQDVFR